MKPHIFYSLVLAITHIKNPLEQLLGKYKPTSGINKNAIVNQPGTYQLMITNTVTGCISTTVTTVTSQTGLIVAQASADTITCVQSTAVLSGAGSSTGAGIVATDCLK